MFTLHYKAFFFANVDYLWVNVIFCTDVKIYGTYMYIYMYDERQTFCLILNQTNRKRMYVYNYNLFILKYMYKRKNNFMYCINNLLHRKIANVKHESIWKKKKITVLYTSLC